MEKGTHVATLMPFSLGGMARRGSSNVRFGSSDLEILHSSWRHCREMLPDR
jgi:hypothetical protein